MSTILVVDDDTVMRQGIAALLKSAQHTVIEASDGDAGLNVALETHPDAILTDVHMPHMNGTDMVAKLRDDAWGAKVPVIILSADDSSNNVNDALELGITSYFAKDSDPATLLDQVASILG